MKNKAEHIIPTDFKFYYKALGIQTVLLWHENRYTNTWNKIETLGRGAMHIKSTNLPKLLLDYKMGKV